MKPQTADWSMCSNRCCGSTLRTLTVCMREREQAFERAAGVSVTTLRTAAREVLAEAFAGHPRRRV